MKERFAVGLALAAALLFGAKPATADVGTGVGADPLRPSVKVVTGKALTLTPLYITNTGTETTTYQITVDPTAVSPGYKVLPKSWVTFAKTRVTLAPKAAVFVKGTMKVPSGTRNGRYRSYVVVTSTPTTPGISGTGAAAATDVVVQVGPASKVA